MALLALHVHAPHRDPDVPPPTLEDFTLWGPLARKADPEDDDREMTIEEVHYLGRLLSDHPDQR